MAHPLPTGDDFDALTTAVTQNQNIAAVTRTSSSSSGDQSTVLNLNQFLDTTGTGRTPQNASNSNDGIQQVSLNDPKNVVIVMQQSMTQTEEPTSVLQDLSSITTNNVMMASSPLTWAKSEILPSDDSMTFVTPPPPGQMSETKVTVLPRYDDENLEEAVANPCLVCGDKASGYHYSVYSCEGCKGFFKRSVQKGLTYTCKENASCHINKFSRNSCQFCRFQKCIQIGMKREAVREDRSPGGKHRHKRQGLDPLDPSDDLFSNQECQETATQQHAKLQRLSMSNSPEAGDNNQSEHPLLESLLSAKPHLYPKGASEKTEGLSVNELMQYGYLELRFIIEWAKKVPGFSDLCLSDQMALLKSSFMELNVLRLAYRSMHLDNKIKFADDVILPLDYCESIGWGKELVDGIIDFAHKLKDISLDLPEFCILNAIILMYPDAQSLEDKVRISDLQSQILDSLRYLLGQRNPQDHKRLGKILLRLPALRTVSAKAAERFLSLTFDGSVELSELVLEMIN